MRKSLIMIFIIMCFHFTSIEDFTFTPLSFVSNDSLLEEEITVERKISIIPEGWNYQSLIALNQSTPDTNYNIKIVLNPSNFDYSRV